MTELWDEGFQALFLKHYPRLVKNTYYLIRNIHDAEEMVEEAFLIYLQKRKSEDIRKPEAYLSVVLGNLQKDYYKSVRRERTVSLESLGELPDNREAHTPLAHSLPAQLLDWEREILLLRYEQNLRYDEIANVLGIEASSCRSRLFRAKAHYKELFEKEKSLQHFPSPKPHNSQEVL